MLNREPTAIIGFIRIAIMALVLFGVPLTLEKQAVLLALAEAGLTLWNRSAVTPVSGGKPPTGGAAVGLIAWVLALVACSSALPADREEAARAAVRGARAAAEHAKTACRLVLAGVLPETPLDPETEAGCAEFLDEPGTVTVPEVPPATPTSSRAPDAGAPTDAGGD